MIQSPKSGSALVDLIADNVDRLINLDVSGYGVIAHLYKAARALADRPITLVAAQRLRERLKDGGNFFVTSGWIMPGTFPYGETDGPIGAATLGRALGIAFGARMVVLTEERMIESTTAACRAAGLNVLTEPDLRDSPRPVHPRFLNCVIAPFPIDDAAAITESRRLFEAYKPKALVAIEKNGPNREGRYSMVDGSDNSDCVAKAGRLFEEAKRRDVLTIGIGDRGNEIGFGAIADVPRTILPFGERATDNTTVDVLVTAAVSNWGASGIAATLAALLNRPEILHDTATESRMLHRCIDAGAVDGFTCRPVPMSDGMQESTHVAICALLNELVRAPAVNINGLFSTPIHRDTSTNSSARGDKS
jgi:D-glutamate cyclase